MVEQYSRRGTDRNLSVTPGLSGALVLADAELLRLALRQLLDNACKYSQPGSSISVNLEVQDQVVAVRVVNIGSLIRSAERARIFERFYRGIEGQFLAPGSGLGLYVARKIVQAQGGNLDLETEDRMIKALLSS